MISIIVPTIDGREHWLERCLTAYCETTPDAEVLIVENSPTCNAGWNIGIAEARGDFIHLSADDLEPHPGWWETGMLALASGFIPCPRVLNSDGTLQSCGDTADECATGTASDVCRVPFFPRRLLDAIYPIPEMQYMGDYWVTRQARRAGWPTSVVRDMIFTHHLAPEGRLDTLAQDIAAYEAHTHRRRRVSRVSPGL